jgi:hypothetical protein
MEFGQFWLDEDSDSQCRNGARYRVLLELYECLSAFVVLLT